MGCNSKKKKSVAKTIDCRSRPNLSEDACGKSCESNQKWESYGQKATSYFKGAFLQVLPLK